MPPWLKKQLTSKSKETSDSKSPQVPLDGREGKKANIFRRIWPKRSRSPSPAPTSTGGESGKLPDETNDISLPPWYPVMINSQILKDLHDWNKTHDDHESLLDSMRKIVSRVMDSNTFNAALDLIPNGTIPARSIVKTLLAVIALGIKIPDRKKDACDFALQVIEDLNAMANALGITPPKEDGSDSIIDQCWTDLEPFCKIMNEICEWAHTQVTSKLAFASDDQVDFQSKLTQANTLFMKLSTIRMIRHISGIKEDVVTLLGYDERRERLKRIESSFRSLIAAKYQYHEQGKQECHEDTREPVLMKLDTWIRDKSKDGTLKRCWWMTGIPATGKTAIAMTAARCLLDHQHLSAKKEGLVDLGDEGERLVVPGDEAPILCAQYFCNYKNDSSDINNLFPTLALQLAEKSPAAAHIIHKTLLARGSIAHAFSRSQAEAIFVNPLCRLAKISTSLTHVVIIDGVDEFEPVEDIFPPQVLNQVFSDLPKNVRVLILSRPTIAIREAIHASIDIEHHDLSTKDSLDCVRAYFSKRLPEIGKRHRLDFPTPGQLDLLCETASGHLGWAKQVYNWLNAYLAPRQGTDLSQQLEKIGKLAIGNLDNLYTLILHHSLIQADPAWPLFLIELQKVLRCLTYLKEPQSISVICHLIVVDHGFDVSKCLIGLSSLYASGIENVDLDTIPVPHKSFFDFLISRAPPEFRVDEIVAHRELASSCFRIMKDELHFNMGGFASPSLLNRDAPVMISGHVGYVSQFFAEHVKGCGKPFCEVEILDWVKHRFLFWLEAVLLVHTLRTESILYDLRNLHSSNEEVNLMLTDAIDFSETAYNAPAIYTVGLPLLPSSSPLFQEYQSHSLVAGRMNESAVTVNRFGSVNAISSCGKWAAIFMTSRLSLSLLSVADGASVWSITLQGCSFLSFSLKGEILVSVSQGTVFVFSVSSGKLRWQFKAEDPGHDMQQVLVSPSHQIILFHTLPSRHVMAYSFPDGKLLWECTIGSIFWESTNDSHCQVGYLPDGRVVIVGRSIDVLDGQSGKLLVQSPTEKKNNRRFISISLDGALIAFDRGNSVVVWNILESMEVAVLLSDVEDLDDGNDRFFSGCFSPFGSLFAGGSGSHLKDNTIRVWARSTWSCVARLYGHVCPITSLAFQCHGGSIRIISASGYTSHGGLSSRFITDSIVGDNTIRIWDVSAVLDGREFDVEVKEGPPEVAGWFRECIPLGGWLGDRPFVFEYPKFKLPEGLKLLDWKIDSESERKDLERDKLDVDF